MTTELPLVVCVDDDEAMLATVARCLRREALEIRATGSAGEALGWIAADPVAVLVSDYDQPEMTAAQLAGHAHRVRPETVRVVLTGRRPGAPASDGLEQVEIFRFLHKPFDNELLRQTVRAAVARNRALRALSEDRERSARREARRAALETAYPGISRVERDPDAVHEVTADPWAEAAALGLAGLTAALERDP